MRSFALFVVVLFASGSLIACESPRERACRSLVIQAKNAEAARTTAASNPRVAEYRAESAARWLRSNAVDEPALKADATALADALDRLAEARLRIAVAAEVLGASDAADLVARSEKVLAYSDDFEKVRSRCGGLADVPLAQQADQCAMRLDYGPDAPVDDDVKVSAAKMKAWAVWSESLPRRPIDETYARARGVAAAIADRGRAEAEVTRLAAALETKCGS